MGNAKKNIYAINHQTGETKLVSENIARHKRKPRTDYLLVDEKPELIVDEFDCFAEFRVGKVKVIEDERIFMFEVPKEPELDLFQVESKIPIRGVK